MEYIGAVQFFLNGKRENPISLFLERGETECRITSRLPQWRHIVGVGATPGKAAGDFEIKLRAACPSEGAYDGPSWNGIKAEKPAPPKPATAPASTPKAEAAPAPGSGSPVPQTQPPLSPGPTA